MIRAGNVLSHCSGISGYVCEARPQPVSPIESCVFPFKYEVDGVTKTMDACSHDYDVVGECPTCTRDAFSESIIYVLYLRYRLATLVRHELE